MGTLVKDIQQDHKDEVLKNFFAKFGTLKLPLCLRCNTKVEKLGVDYEYFSNSISVWVECHGRREAHKAHVPHIMSQGFIEMRAAFHPNSITEPAEKGAR